MCDFVEKSVEQVCKVIDGFMSVVQKMADIFEGLVIMVQISVCDVICKIFIYIEQNLNVVFDFVQRMVCVKDMQEVMQIQVEFVCSQFEVMQIQMKEFGFMV